MIWFSPPTVPLSHYSIAPHTPAAAPFRAFRVPFVSFVFQTPPCHVTQLVVYSLM